jgi:hypothetical protein
MGALRSAARHEPVGCTRRNGESADEQEDHVGALKGASPVSVSAAYVSEAAETQNGLTLPCFTVDRL